MDGKLEIICSDEELVKMAGQGDREAFGELVKRHHRHCVGLASAILRDRAEAEDEAQNAYWSAYQHLDQFQGEAEFSTWLNQIVVNRCLMLIRVQKRTRLLHLDAGIPQSSGISIDLPCLGPDPEDVVGTLQVRDVLLREIRRIPPILRDVVLLRDVEQLPFKEVGTRLGISVSAVKSRLLRARMELRNRVMRHCGRTGCASLITRGTVVPTRLRPVA